MRQVTMCIVAAGLVGGVPARAATLEAPIPGEPDRTNTLRVTGAPAGASLALFRGSVGGSSVVGSCTVDVDSAEEVATAVADVAGAATLSFDVPAVHSGRTVGLQALDAASCTVTTVVEHTWRVEAFVGDWNPDVADGIFQGGAPFDVFGNRTRFVGDADGDDRPDVAFASPLNDANGSQSGMAYVVYGPTAGVWNIDADADLRLVGATAGEWAGLATSWVDDTDGDGISDLLIGSRLNSVAGPEAGAAYLIRMPRYGTLDLGSADVVLRGEAPGDQAGMFLTAAGDTDGDGLGDFWVGAPFEGSGGQGAGAVYLLRGPVPDGTHDVGAVASAKLVGEEAGDMAMATVPLDADGDGLTDVFVGAQGSDRAAPDAGAVYLMHAPFPAEGSLADAAAIYTGEAAADLAGAALFPAHDLNGDGIDELLVCARDESTTAPQAGALYLLHSPYAGEHSLGDAAVLKLLGEGEVDYAGAHAATCDVDADGDIDLLVTAHHAGPGEQTGRTYLFYGPLPTGTVELADADATFHGQYDTHNVGQDVNCMDIDGDGFDDIIMGAEGANTPGGAYAGAAYLFYGRARPTPRDSGETGGTGSTGATGSTGHTGEPRSTPRPDTGEATPVPSPSGGQGEPTDPAEASGCGCDSGAATGLHGALVGLLGLVLVRRRGRYARAASRPIA